MGSKRFLVCSILACAASVLGGSVLSQERGAAPSADEASGFRFTPGIRLHTIWQVSDREGTPTNEFLVEMARLGMSWEVGSMVDGKVSADLEQVFREEKALLRDAYVRVQPLKAAALRIGQFKRPFSAIELRSRGKLETVRRGLGNELLIEDLGFGDRDLGVMFDGQVGGKKRHVKYMVGLFNGGGANVPETDMDWSKDLVARVEGRPWKWLTAGVNASFKWFDTEGEVHSDEDAWAVGADLRFKRKALFVLAEWILAENWDRCRYAEYEINCRLEEHTPKAWDMLLMAAYRWRLGGPLNIALEPVFKGEYLVPEHDVSGSGAGRFFPGSNQAGIWFLVPGVNLHLGEYFRVMANVEWAHAGSDVPAGWEVRESVREWTDGTRFLLQFALDI